MPATNLKNAVAYEDWIDEVDSDYAWKEFDERDRRRPLLHLRHDRQSEGRALFASLEHSAFDDGERRPQCLTVTAERFGSARRADVPRQFLGPRALLPDARRAHGDAGPKARRRLGLRSARNREGDDDRRRADRLARPPAISAQGEQETLDAQVRRHRRLGLSARDDPRLRGGLRRRRAPRLGHDGNEPGRLGRRAQADRSARSRTRRSSRSSPSRAGRRSASR